MDPANFMCRIPLLIRKDAICLFRHSNLTLAAALFVFILDSQLKPAAVAEELAEYQKRQLHDFEQCAGSCQIDVDERLLRCPEYKDDSENIEAQICNTDAQQLYQRCLQMCPADPRPDQL